MEILLFKGYGNSGIRHFILKNEERRRGEITDSKYLLLLDEFLVGIIAERQVFLQLLELGVALYALQL